MAPPGTPPQGTAFGWVIDDDGPEKRAAGGAARFAETLPDRMESLDEDAHLLSCPSCQVQGEAYSCIGLLLTPISANAERWLVERLPDDIESLPGFLLRKAITEYGYTGAEGHKLREAGLLAAAGPFTRHYGPFFRRYPVSSEQLLEELLCAGDVAPSHALAVLVHLRAIAVDGRTLLALEEGPLLGELIEKPETRRARTTSTVDLEADDDVSLVALQRYLRGLHAAFVVDAAVQLFGGPPAEPQPR